MDIRWLQRFNNFKKAFNQLKIAVEMNSYSDLEREGMIQRFEYSFELAWNTIKDLLEYKGNNNILGSRDAIRLGFQLGLLEDGEGWMRMITSRSLSTHTYDEQTANEIAKLVKEEYYYLFENLIKRLENEREK